jgi:hypothetical protein
MKESANRRPGCALSFALGLACVFVRPDSYHLLCKRGTMSQINDLPLSAIPAADSPRGQRIAFVQAQWHSDIVHQARDAFLAEMKRQGVPLDTIDVFDVPGAFEIPFCIRK